MVALNFTFTSKFMFNSTFFTLLSFITIVSSSKITVKEIAAYSIKNLISINSIDDLSENWVHLGDSYYEEGRIILTPKPLLSSADEDGIQFGSLWSSISNPLSSFTTELTIRSLGNYGLTNAGFSFFIVDESSIDIKSNDNFGGPSSYKGFQILLNMDEKLGPNLRTYLNDGSKSIDIANDYIAAYKYEYQNSQVPVTLKIAYENKFFKITCDNKLLFQTNEINFSELLNSNNIKFGITALSSKNIKLHEQFEILKLTTYDQVTPDMKMETEETLITLHSTPDESKEKQRSSLFLQQQQKLRERLSTQKSGSAGFKDNDFGHSSLSSSNTDHELQKIKEILTTLVKKVQQNDNNQLQVQLLSLSDNVGTLNDNYIKLINEFNILNNKYAELSNMFRKQFDLLDNYDTSLRSFDKVLQNQLKSSDNLDNKLSTISSYYSNINSRDLENSNSKSSTNDDPFSKLKSLIYMIFLPLLALVGLVALWIHKLRNDIRHSKVL
ncbi:hypothetical protein C6P40_004196 [Pichia californica]|uniref:L-type lectin-like domain-containing protein n=1 Tax=Pichia californica TaxID=460514 RepID=A0A9P6WII8_9ASCO|nr:hypothetical protein C6P42_003897 [[Candida] californica]KAG0686408.1 hypothetical protein C6P40_004196 [[Candida] californica]